MIIAKTLSELHALLAEIRSPDSRLSLVPTMGALHAGHLSLVDAARQQSDRVVVSIFVNPTQFGPREDYRIYPRTPEQDLQALEGAGVDLVFIPRAADMYPDGAAVSVDPGLVGSTFEGAVRPEHFRGVLTIVSKLFNLVQPNVAVFGQKDAQQLFLIRRMVEDLNFPIDIIEGETVRETDGLARSSRNVYLKTKERTQAAVLYRALRAGEKAFIVGDRTLPEVRHAMETVLGGVSEFVADYATAVGEKSFLEEDPLPDSIRLIVAGKLGSVRLIDNFRVHALVR
jgi:pantoate--beta-alanine ligase